MADDEISTLALTVREEQYDELADTRRPPYFGEREPTCHVITADEKIYLQPMPYTQRLIEALKFGYQLARMPVVGLRRGARPNTTLRASSPSLRKPSGTPEASIIISTGLSNGFETCFRSATSRRPRTRG